MYTVPQRDWLTEVNWTRAAPDSVVLDGDQLLVIAMDSLMEVGGRGWSFDSAAKKCYAKFQDNGDAHSVTFYFSQGTSSIIPEIKTPFQFHLEQNYPNPFNPATTFGFTLQVSGLTTLKIYDVIGREVATLINENLEAGVYHQKQFEAEQFSSGVYFAKLTSGGNSRLRKMVLMK